VGQAHEHAPIGCVLADAEFDSERNHTFCREQFQAQSIIPAKLTMPLPLSMVQITGQAKAADRGVVPHAQY